MDELNNWQFFTPEERARDIVAATRAVAEIKRSADRAQSKARAKRAAGSVPRYVRAARAAGLQVARVDLRDDGTVSIVVGEPVAAQEGQGGRSRLDDMLGT